VELQKCGQNKEIFNLKNLFHIKINIERFKPGKGPTQCYRCQGLNHAQSTCRLPAACVKCAGNHHYSECTKKREDGPAKCANCPLAHPSNYRGCSIFQNYKKSAKPKLAPKGQKETNSKDPAVPLNSQKSWAQAATPKTSEAKKETKNMTNKIKTSKALNEFNNAFKILISCLGND